MQLRHLETKEEEFDFATEFLKVVEPKLTAMADLRREHELVKDAWDRLFFINYCNLYWREKQIVMVFTMGLMDENDNCVGIKVRQECTITFGEGSTVIIGKSERSLKMNGYRMM